MTRFIQGIVTLTLVASLMAAFSGTASAKPIGDPAFERTWSRTDRPVAEQRVVRTWMWGPEPFTDSMVESYAEGPGGRRVVQYFDKSRMEITNPSGDANSIWFVTNGLLVVEMMTGKIQTGDNQFTDAAPAQVTVAGDLTDPDGPTYATFANLRSAEPLAEGSVVTQRVNRAGQVTDDAGKAGLNVTTGNLVAGTNHTIAEPFWAFMNSSGMVYQNGSYVEAALFESPFYATGLPITEPYWTTVLVGGESRDVMVQCFERRCLTYTPDNPAEWQVEMGNVGKHYYEWRYGQIGDQPPPVPQLPPLPPEDTPPPPTPSADQYFGTLAPGTPLPSDQECASRVRRYDWEPRPSNRQANFTTGTTVAEISGANAEGQAAFAHRVNGNFTGWTDEIIQWGACKWGIDENVVRGIITWQSWWHQWYTSNDGESFGIMSVNSRFHPGTYPTSINSTAFNIDYTLAWHRACFEGYFDWVPDEAQGDLWGCAGLWRSGGWKDPVALDYIASIQLIIDTRPWLQQDFYAYSG